MPTEQLAIAITGLLSGLGVEELAKPGLVPDELFGQTIELLLKDPGDRTDPAAPRGVTARVDSHRRPKTSPGWLGARKASAWACATPAHQAGEDGACPRSRLVTRSQSSASLL
jgi:hypothetical protein